MARFGDVRRWDAEPLNAAVGELNRRYDQLMGLADELAAACQPSGWVGNAAYTAAVEARKRNDRLEEQVAGVAAVRRALAEAADAITGVRHAIAEIDSFAGANGFAVADDGAIVERGVVGDPRDLDRVRAELTDRVEQVLRRANDIDEDLTTVVNRARASQTLDGDVDGLTSAAQAGTARGGLSTAGPPKDGSPYDNAGWWDALSDLEKQRIIKEHPDWIGNLDGVPAAARDAANRARLPLERTAIQQQIDDLEARRRNLANTQRNPRLYQLEMAQLGKQLDGLKAKLDSIASLELMVKRDGRQLLLMDMSGDRAKAAIGSGNVDNADHVAVFTPGMNTTVGNMSTDVDDMERLMDRAGHELVKSGGGTVATVTWLGYEPPGFSANPWDAAGRGLATEGANRLAPFLNGIDAARDKDPHLTALGHSYGSLTTGIALQQNTGVDEAVVFGSPGIGTSDPAAVQVGKGHLYNVEAEGDVIADLGDPLIHGADPSSLPVVQGSTHEAVAPDGRQLKASSGHGEYLVDETTSQYNMSVIVAGQPHLVIPVR